MNEFRIRIISAEYYGTNWDKFYFILTNNISRKSENVSRKWYKKTFYVVYKSQNINFSRFF